MDCEKLVQEKTEMQRHYVMVMFFFLLFLRFVVVSFWRDSTRRVFGLEIAVSSSQL